VGAGKGALHLLGLEAEANDKEEDASSPHVEGYADAEGDISFDSLLGLDGDVAGEDGAGARGGLVEVGELRTKSGNVGEVAVCFARRYTP
jgi:hypothetical protein